MKDYKLGNRQPARRVLYVHVCTGFACVPFVLPSSDFPRRLFPLAKNRSEIPIGIRPLVPPDESVLFRSTCKLRKEERKTRRKSTREHILIILRGKSLEYAKENIEIQRLHPKSQNLSMKQRGLSEAI
jgi:hypothetical protein